MARILLIEDDVGLRASLTRALETEKHTVRHASNGDEALEKLREAQADLVICDYNLGEADTAADVLEKMRIHSEFRSIPFVLTTGDPLPKVVVLRGHSPDAVLEKPFTLPELKQVVKRVLQNPAM